MSSNSPISPFDPDGQDWWSRGSGSLTRQIRDVGRLLFDVRMQLRFGELSRAPLRLVRLQIKEGAGEPAAECDWIARKPDPWDADLAREIGRRHASLQALKDAIDIRALLFATLPQLAAARLRVYRETYARSRELIIAGHLRRRDSTFRSVHSLAMRAKLVGLRFRLENGSLDRLPRDEQFGFGD
jgi:hypothetical protein